MSEIICKCILFFLLLFPNFLMANEFGVPVNQEFLESKLSCEKLQLSAMCLDSIVYYDEPKAYIYKFKINTSYSESDLEKIINFRVDFMSSLLNPITAQFFEVEPLFLDKIDTQIYPAENIIVELSVLNKNKNYTAYVYPKVIENKIMLISGFNEGHINTYQYLTSKCNEIKSITKNIKNKTIIEYCEFYNY
ncbi:hypothetical protein [Vibrio sp. TRT 17S01]|uniref:hypothetical protein n=1 Tax=Vibrio sp. TRT 17S01 TaxID=3418505 RepID=UPI003CE97D77